MLGRFANIREGAPEPTDRILVQFDRVLKFVAGDDMSTVIVDTGKPVDAAGKALVSSRLLLQAAKTIRGKGDVAFELDGKGGAVLRTNTGGRVVLPRAGEAIPGWVRPSVESAHAIALEIPDGFWPDLSKVVGLGPDKLYLPWDLVHFELLNGNLNLVWTDNYRWVQYELARSVGLAPYKYMGSVSVEFIKSLKAFAGTTSLVLLADRIEVHNGPSSAVSRLGWLMKHDESLYQKSRLNGMRPVDVNAGATANRKDLIDSLKAVASADEHGRVTMMVGPGEVKVYAYHHEGEGSMTLTAKTQIRGHVSFKSELATKLLSGLKDKEVTVSFPTRGTGPIQFKESTWGWLMYLAPVAL